MGRSDTFLSLAEQLLDLFLLDRPQILAVADEAVGVVAAARVDMLQDLHGQFSQLFVLLLKVFLDHLEDVAQIDLISFGLWRLESFIHHKTREASNFLLITF